MKRLIEGSTFGKERFRSKVHSGGGDHPTWNESHTFNLKNMKLDSHLKVKLYDKDTIKDDYIAAAKINLDELLAQDRKGMKYYPLFKKGTLGYGEKAESIGQVGIGVSFNCTEIPQGQADLKSQVRDTLVRKNQQIAGVSEQHQQAHPPQMQGPGQTQQPLQQQPFQSGTHQTQAVNQPISQTKVPQSQIPQSQYHQSQVPQTQGQVPQTQGPHYM